MAFAQNTRQPKGGVDVSVGDVVQIDGDDPRFAYCYLTVTEVKTWGVQGYVQVPHSAHSAQAFYRCPFARLTRIGIAEWVDRDNQVSAMFLFGDRLYRCPNTGRIIDALPHDDKAICRCGRSNPFCPQEQTERTGTHIIRFLQSATIDEYLDQREADDPIRSAHKKETV